METFRLSVKDKGRTVLPVALQRACGFAPGAELLARPIGKGRFVVESPDAVLERIWSRAPDGAEADAVDALATWRTDSDAERRARLEASATDSLTIAGHGPSAHGETDGDEEASAERAARLLAEFGL